MNKVNIAHTQFPIEIQIIETNYKHNIIQPHCPKKWLLLLEHLLLPAMHKTFHFTNTLNSLLLVTYISQSFIFD